MEVEMSERRNAQGAVHIVLHTLASVCFMAMFAAAQAQQTVLEVIDLKYRSADQIVPMLKPLLAPGGTISALQNRVVVRTTPENLAELHKVLDAVDTRPRRLMISVRQEAQASEQSSETEISGSVGTGGARATVPGSRSQQDATARVGKGDNTVRGKVSSSQSGATERGAQSVQVLEGNEAFIRIGQSVPVSSRTVTQTPQGTKTTNSVEYRDAETGFRVRPRVSGDQVTLQISTRRDTLADAAAQTFNVQDIDTVVSGRMGEWIEIGGVVQSQVQTQSSTTSRRSSDGANDRKVFLKVDQLP
jgi:type II secretory pathway component GspD/PulD (secretin)